jgi:hypothetical protein
VEPSKYHLPYHFTFNALNHFFAYKKRCIFRCCRRMVCLGNFAFPADNARRSDSALMAIPLMPPDGLIRL